MEDDALGTAIDSGTVDTTGLDVRDPEPPADWRLGGRDDVVCPPHVAWYSEESRVDMSRAVAEHVAPVLDWAAPTNPIDPESGWF